MRPERKRRFLRSSISRNTSAECSTDRFPHELSEWQGYPQTAGLNAAHCSREYGKWLVELYAAEVLPYHVLRIPRRGALRGHTLPRLPILRGARGREKLFCRFTQKIGKKLDIGVLMGIIVLIRLSVTSPTFGS